MALAYLDARDVRDRLDEVCGKTNWQCRYVVSGEKTCCEVGIRIPSPDGQTEWVWKADGSGDTDFEGAKGAFSGAFKRAAVRWGIGRYLYDLGEVWVDLDNDGRAIAQKEYEKLQRILRCHQAILQAADAGNRPRLQKYKEEIRSRQFGKDVTESLVILIEEKLGLLARQSPSPNAAPSDRKTA